MLAIIWYCKSSGYELVASIFGAAFLTEIIVYLYSGIRKAIGKDNIRYEEYYVTIFGNEKSLGISDDGVVESFVTRLIAELVFLIGLLLAYTFFVSQLKDVISKETIQYISIALLFIPYILALIRITKYASYFYKTNSYIGIRDDEFKIHNEINRMSRICTEAPDIICSNKGLPLLVIIFTWPLRAFFGNVAIIFTKCLSLASVFVGFVVLGLEVIGILIISFKDIVPAVEMHQMTVSIAFSYWPAAILVIISSMASFYLIKYRYEIMDMVDDIYEAMIAFRHGMT